MYLLSLFNTKLQSNQSKQCLYQYNFSMYYSNQSIVWIPYPLTIVHINYPCSTMFKCYTMPFIILMINSCKYLILNPRLVTSNPNTISEVQSSDFYSLMTNWLKVKEASGMSDRKYLGCQNPHPLHLFQFSLHPPPTKKHVPGITTTQYIVNVRIVSENSLKLLLSESPISSTVKPIRILWSACSTHPLLPPPPAMLQINRCITFRYP